MTERITQCKIVAGHFLFALVVTSIQPLLPVFQEEFLLGLFHSSILPLSVTLSVMVANLFVGFFIAHWGQRYVLIGSFVLQILGLTLVCFSVQFLMVLFGFALIGLASGAAFTSLITVYSELPHKYQNFGLFHAFFGVGGIFAPIGVSFWLSLNDTNFRGLLGLYALLFVVLLVFIVTSKKINNKRFKDFSITDMVTGLSSPITILGVSILALYAAIEIGGTTWSVNLNMMEIGVSKVKAHYLLSGFWLAFTCARLFTDLIAHKMGEIFLVVLCAAIAVLSLFFWAGGVSPYFFILLGVALGPMLPVVQKYVNNRLPGHQRGLFNGVTYLATGVTSTLYIPFMGWLAEISLVVAYMPLIINLGLILFLLYLFKIKTA